MPLVCFVGIFEQRISGGDAGKNEAADRESRKENVPSSLGKNIRESRQMRGQISVADEKRRRAIKRRTQQDVKTKTTAITTNDIGNNSRENKRGLIRTCSYVHSF